VVSFFKEKSTAAVFGLIVVSIASRAFFWVHPPHLIISPDDGLIYYLLSQLPRLPVVPVALLYHLIVVVQALRLNYALNDLRMFSKPVFTTALAYVLLTAFIPAWNNLSSAFLINSMIIWLLFRILKLYSSPNPKSLLFNIGLITSCTVLLYYPAMPLVVLAFFTVAIYRSFRLNEWLILLLGILTPFYFLGGWLFLNDKLDMVLQQATIFQLQIIRPANIPLTIVTFSMAVVAVITGVYMWQANSGRMVIQIRKNWSILFFMLLLFIPGIFFIRNAWPNALLMAAVPASAFVSNTWLYPKRNLFPVLLFWLFIAIIVYNNWVVTKF